MRKRSKLVFFSVLALILALAYTSFFGISSEYGDYTNVIFKGADEIRLGIDIRGGVEVTFTPADGVDATDEQMRGVEEVINTRLVTNNITDSEVYTDFQNDRIIVRFPWTADETEFDPAAAIEELAATAMLTFREGSEVDALGAPTGVTAENIVLTGDDIASAEPQVYTENGVQNFIVSLTLNESGRESFFEATSRLSEEGGVISIWMDDVMISAPSVDEPIDDVNAIIQGNFTAEEAQLLADQINGGALPFALTAENYNTISPSLGSGALNAMVIAGIIAFILICAYIIFSYRLPGVVASISLLGQLAGSIAAISGFLAVVPSFTLTLPGIAGIILAIGIGVDANVIAAERIKEEINLGKSIDSSVNSGFKKAFSAVFDGNVTIVIVALILMAAFGPPTNIFAQIFNTVFFFFSTSIAGEIYSFGYTLLVGVILNFIFGIGATRLMLKSVSKFKIFRKPALYGYKGGAK